MYKIIIQVFYIILRMGVPWVCRLEHTLVWFLILLAFLWVYQLGHRPSWRPSDHREHANGEPFPSSCFYCSFSWPFFFLSLIPSWNSDNIFLLGDAVQIDAVFTVKHCLGGKLPFSAPSAVQPAAAPSCTTLLLLPLCRYYQKAVSKVQFYNNKISQKMEI